MVDLSIGELAARARLRPSAIRYYEQAGLLPPPARKSGRRRYDASSLRRLGFVVQARKAGLPIARIKQWLEAWDAPGRGGLLLRGKIAEELAELALQMKRIEDLRARLAPLLDCRCASLADCQSL